MKYETDSIVIDAEIKDNDGRMEISIIAKVKDPGVFPPLNVADKKVMAKVMDIIANQQQSLLSMRGMQAAPHKDGVDMIHVTCPKCGHQFQTEGPCCDEKRLKVRCPRCRAPLSINIKG